MYIYFLQWHTHVQADLSGYRGGEWKKSKKRLVLDHFEENLGSFGTQIPPPGHISNVVQTPRR